MIKKNLLQLFAEDPPAEPPAEPPKEPEGGEKTFTQAEVDKMIDDTISAKFAKWQKKKEEEVKEAERLAGMNAQQKAEAERDKVQKELDELKAAQTLSEMRATGRKMLREAEINVPDELVNLLVTKDADETKTSIETFTKLFNDAVSKAVKDALAGEPPKNGSGSGKTITKEEILAIKNPVQRQELMAQNIELFE